MMEFPTTHWPADGMQFSASRNAGGERWVQDRRGHRIPDESHFAEWAIAMLADVGIITTTLNLRGFWDDRDPHDRDIARASILAYAKLNGMEAKVKCWAHQVVDKECDMVTAYEALRSTSVRCSLVTPNDAPSA